MLFKIELSLVDTKYTDTGKRESEKRCKRVLPEGKEESLTRGEGEG